MNTTPTKAIERLAWRFKQNKMFTPNENDIEALNTIIVHFNKENETVSHLPFAKLFLLTYHDLLPIFGEEKTLYRINEILDSDLSILYSKLEDRLNAFDLNDYFLATGIHPTTIYNCDTEKEINELKQKNNPFYKAIDIKQLKGRSFEEVVENSNALINHLLKTHSK